MLHKGQKNKNENVEPREGQREPLCNNLAKSRCPSLCYEKSEQTQQQEIDHIYDIIFDEIIRIKSKRL